MLAVTLHPTLTMPPSSHQGRQSSEAGPVALPEVAILWTFQVRVSGWKKKEGLMLAFKS